jgi:hypothetical protein
VILAVFRQWTLVSSRPYNRVALRQTFKHGSLFISEKKKKWKTSLKKAGDMVWPYGQLFSRCSKLPNFSAPSSLTVAYTFYSWKFEIFWHLGHFGVQKRSKKKIVKNSSSPAGQHPPRSQFSSFIKFCYTTFKKKSLAFKSYVGWLCLGHTPRPLSSEQQKNDQKKWKIQVSQRASTHHGVSFHFS